MPAEVRQYVKQDEGLKETPRRNRGSEGKAVDESALDIRVVLHFVYFYGRQDGFLVWMRGLRIGSESPGMGRAGGRVGTILLRKSGPCWWCRVLLLGAEVVEAAVARFFCADRRPF